MMDKGISISDETFHLLKKYNKTVPDADLRRKVEMPKAKIKQNATAEEEMTVPKKFFAKQGSAVEQWERELQRAPDSQTERKPVLRKGPAVERWEKELLRAFDGQIESKLVIEDQDFTTVDSRYLTRDLKSTQKLILRTAQQTSYDETITLKKFDPNFMSQNKICCRSPGCNETKKRHPASSRSTSKEDLYLCTSHRKLVEDYVTTLCAAKGMDVSKKYYPEDFEGYISMIGLLESAYFLLVKRPRGSEGVVKGKPAILSEVFINLRNFLMIINALLNPDDENLFTALNRPMEILMEILKILRDNGREVVEVLTELVVLLRSVIEHILFAFGIVYSWVHLALSGNPGAQIGAGIGGFIGMAGLFVVSPAVGLIAMAGRSVFGGLTGGGIYNLQRQRREQQEADEGLRRYQEYVQAHRVQQVQEDRHRDVARVENDLQGMAEPVDNDVVLHITGSEEGDLTLAFMFLRLLFN